MSHLGSFRVHSTHPALDRLLTIAGSFASSYFSELLLILVSGVLLSAYIFFPKEL
jgi:hypothetical protein